MHLKAVSIALFQTLTPVEIIVFNPERDNYFFSVKVPISEHIVHYCSHIGYIRKMNHNIKIFQI